MGFYLPVASCQIFSCVFLLFVENLGFPSEVAPCLECRSRLALLPCAEDLPHVLVELFHLCENKEAGEKKALSPCHTWVRPKRSKTSQPGRQGGEVRGARGTSVAGERKGDPQLGDTATRGLWECPHTCQREMGSFERWVLQNHP